jgi:hypothetical protein
VSEAIKPRAWAWKDEPSGQEVYSGWEMPRPVDDSVPLYDQAAIDAAVAAERERCAKLCEQVSAEGTMLGGEDAHALVCADRIRALTYAATSPAQ